MRTEDVIPKILQACHWLSDLKALLKPSVFFVSRSPSSPSVIMAAVTSVKMTQFLREPFGRCGTNLKGSTEEW